MSSIPVLSLKPIVDGAPQADEVVARELLPILQSWGAFQLVDHGVPVDVMSGAFKAAERFFCLPLEQRMTIRVGRDNRGYVPMHQTHYPGNKPDLKESFNVGRPALTPDDPDVKAGKPLHGVNRWPDLDGFREPVENYFNAVTALGDRLLGPLAICLGMNSGALRQRYGKAVAFMRLFHYPPDSNVEEFYQRFMLQCRNSHGIFMHGPLDAAYYCTLRISCCATPIVHPADPGRNPRRRWRRAVHRNGGRFT